MPKQTPICDNPKCRFNFVQCDSDAERVMLSRGEFIAINKDGAVIEVHRYKREDGKLVLCECCFEAVRMNE